MTNNTKYSPMLSVERELLEEMLAAMKETHSLPAKYYGSTLGDRVRALLDDPEKDYVLINGMYFSHAEILEWREKACTEMEKAAQQQGEPVAPWFYFVECEDPDYSGLFNHESEAQTQAIDHGGSVVKLWNVPPTWRPEPKTPAGFWQWLDSAYRDGSKGEEAKFTKYNMEVAYSAGMYAEQPAPVAVVKP